MYPRPPTMFHENRSTNFRVPFFRFKTVKMANFFVSTPIIPISTRFYAPVDRSAQNLAVSAVSAKDVPFGGLDDDQ